ncbi:MAG: histidine phosphatase family protein [Acholeplasma sp.]|nr:histidine phosphatase family protein [Acholeplasma sp.]
MKIYAIRHGETDYNKLRLVQGLMDNRLNKNGIDQANKVGLYLKQGNYTFDKIYATSLSRAYDTASIIKNWLEYTDNISTFDGFIERDFGPFEGKPVDETIKIISKDGFKQKGYEDNEQMLSRINNALLTLYKTNENNSVMFVCHSHTIKALLMIAEKHKYNFLTYLNNASMCVFEFDGVKLKVLNHNIVMI